MRETSPPARSAGEQNVQDRFYPSRFDRKPGVAPLGFHVTLRLEDDRPIATTVRAQRIVARVVLAQGEKRGLLSFGAADNHIHAALATDAKSAGAFARYVGSALRWHLGLGAPFSRARIRPLHDQRHAYSTFHYCHRQDVRHELGLDHAREGTSLPDILGFRALSSSFTARVRAHLPRVRHEDLIAPFPPATFDEHASFDPSVLVEAAAAALALPDVLDRSADGARARRAVIHAVGSAITSRDLGEMLGLGVRAVQAIRTTPAESLLVLAVQRQARLRSALDRDG